MNFLLQNWFRIDVLELFSSGNNFRCMLKTSFIKSDAGEKVHSKISNWVQKKTLRKIRKGYFLFHNLDFFLCYEFVSYVSC